MSDTETCKTDNMLTPWQAAGILGNLDGSMGIAGWRWLFIIEGVITIGVAIAAGFILPDYPATTKWLNEEERNFASWRLMVDINESDETHSRSIWEGVKLCLTDYRLYLFVLTQHMSILSQTFQYFFPSIVQTLGYGEIETLLLTVPGMFSHQSVSTLAANKADPLLSLVRNLPRLHRRDLVRRHNRRPQPPHLRTHDVRRSRQRHRRRHHSRRSPLLRHVPRKLPRNHPTQPSTQHPNKSAPQMPMGAVSAYQIIVSWVANSFPRPLVKRSSAIAIGNCVANAASIYGSYMYPSSDGPRYIPGSGANAAICLSIIGLALVLRYVHKYENKKLKRAEQEAMAGGGEAGVVDVDHRAVGFRYVY